MTDAQANNHTVLAGIFLLVSGYILSAISGIFLDNGGAVIVSTVIIVVKRIIAIWFILKVCKFKKKAPQVFIVLALFVPGISLIILGSSNKKPTTHTPHTHTPRTQQRLSLTNVFWSFSEPRYSYLSDYRTALYRYNEELNPHFIMNLQASFTSKHEAVINCSYHENYSLNPIDDEFNIRTMSSEGFTIDEFMYEIHAYLSRRLPKERVYHFEGVSSNGEANGIPKYKLHLRIQ